MKKLIAIFWKDTLIRFSSWSEWLFFLILPIVFTFVLAGGTNISQDSRIPITVADQANSPLSGQLIATLEASPTVRVNIKPLTEAEAEFAAGDVSSILVIPANFDLAQLQAGGAFLDFRQQPNNINSLGAYQAVQAAVTSLNSGIGAAQLSMNAANQIRPFSSDMERNAYFESALAEGQQMLEAAPERVTTIRGGTEDPIDYDPRANSSAGQLITWVFIPLFGISGAFAYERVTGTLRRLFTTPTRKATYLLGALLGAVFWALVQMLLLVLFGTFVMKLNWGQSPGALAAVLVSSALAASAIGVTLGAFVKTEGQASGLSILMGMVMALLGGCWYPLELFPNAVQEIVKVLPTRWAMQGMLDLVLRQQGLSAVLPEVAVLLGFAVVFYTVGILRFRYE